jgi:hypothetical protein
MYPHSYAYLIFYKVTQNSLFKTVTEKIDICMQKTETIYMYLTCKNINSKWMTDFNIRPETLKLVNNKVGNTLELIVTGSNL